MRFRDVTLHVANVTSERRLLLLSVPTFHCALQWYKFCSWKLTANGAAVAWCFKLTLLRRISQVEFYILLILSVFAFLLVVSHISFRNKISSAFSRRRLYCFLFFTKVLLFFCILLSVYNEQPEYTVTNVSLDLNFTFTFHKDFGCFFVSVVFTLLFRALSTNFPRK